MKAAEYGPLIVAYRNGGPVHLNEIAHVSDGVEQDKVASWFNDERSIVLAVQRQPGTNTVEVVDAPAGAPTADIERSSRPMPARR
jgi:hydrophobic/amphiphilic exporter-1 (mainly G- bacteria), HAE1 family